MPYKPVYSSYDMDRIEKMRAMYYHPTNPKSLEEVGMAFRLTRERVRQLFVIHGIPRRERSETKHIKWVIESGRQRRVVE